MRWERVQQQLQQGVAIEELNGPRKRWGHTCNSIKGGRFLYVFGGYGKDNCQTNQVHVFDTVWKQAITTGTPPSARDSHTCSSWRDKIIVIGGEDGHDYYLSDVHILDTETLVWEELNTSGQKLPPRAGHSTVSFGKNLFVFGGFTDAQNLYDDLHMLNVETGIWTMVMTTGDGPSARFSVAGDCLDPLKGGVLMFIGGCNKSLEALEDMYYLHTGLTRVQDEWRMEKLSLKKQLKLKCQEQNLNYSVHEKVLVQIDTNADFHHTFLSYTQPGRENFPLNQTQHDHGKKTFQAKVTESLPHGYTIETIVDGKLLRGILFSNKRSSPQIVSHNNRRKRASAESGVVLNGGYNSKSKTSKTLNQDAVENIKPDNAHGMESTAQEPKMEAAAVPDLKNLAPYNVYLSHEVPPIAEPSATPLNLNDDMPSDTGFLKEKSTAAEGLPLCH
ncbi:PREDICTED: host cell factor-like [Populus euphratica]|uniref:Host cell factor-like n=1 Tax=Populus euphratica TaxID=75702 RepID=A0AAJ6TK21_POPEU|nr:PREDICTED: host cell factor-like [Populus euphratica]